MNSPIHDPVKGIIFDLDGTLLYTLEDIRRNLNRALVLHGHSPLELGRVRDLVGHGLRRLASDALPPGSSQSEADELYHKLSGLYSQDPVGVSTPYEGILPLLDRLQKSGLRLGVLSNKDHALVEHICHRLFPGAFNPAGGREDGVSPKPDPEGILGILERWNLPASQVLYVGDSEVDAATAAAAGTPFVGVAWGYRDRDVLRAAGARRIIDEPRELEELLFS